MPANPVTHTLKYSKCNYDFEPKVPVTITFVPPVRADNTTECHIDNFFAPSSQDTELRIDDVEEDDVALLGMPTEDDWEMHGPFVDKTLMRNVLAHHLSGQMSRRYAPKTRWGEVLLSSHENGFPGAYQYQGGYVFTEKIEVDTNRVNVRKPPKSRRGDAAPGESGYLFSVGNTRYFGTGGARSNFTSVGQNETVGFLFVDPHAGEVGDYRLRDYIRQTISDFETVLFSLKSNAVRVLSFKLL